MVKIKTPTSENIATHMLVKPKAINKKINPLKNNEKKIFCFTVLFPSFEIKIATTSFFKPNIKIH